MMHENEAVSGEKIQWHPGFYAAAELELRMNREELDFHREYNLSKKPLQIDLLVVKKLKDVLIQNKIGRIFRRYNIIEYKSPDDGMSIDDFCKTLGYAYFYKGMSEKVNEVPLGELTVSLFRYAKPQKLLKELLSYGWRIKEYAKGIYYIEGVGIPVQIVVMEELPIEEHPFLKILTRKITEKAIRNFANHVNGFTEPCDMQNADVVLHVSVLANRKEYSKARRSATMEALRELFSDELENAEREGRKEGEYCLNLLYSKLEQDGRQEDIFRAIKNPELLGKLYKEYGIE